MKKFRQVSIVVFAVVLTLSRAGLISAATAVDLGTAEGFGVLAGSGITNTGTTTITGDVGTYPTTTETGFGSVTITGTNHAGDAVTQGAKTDLTTAYNDAAGQASNSDLTGQDLGGMTLTPGTYTFSSSAGLTGALTLNALGNPNAVFIFQIGSTLTTASSSSVVLTNGAQSCNVFWQVGSSATLGTNSTFVGTIMALTSITLTTGVEVDGRVLARNGAVTLDTNTITVAVCDVVATGNLYVVKEVVNDSGRNATISNFNLHVKLSGTDVSGSPATGTGTPGTAYALIAGTYVVSEDVASLYTASFSGDCDASGSVDVVAGEDVTCTITNNDIAEADVDSDIDDEKGNESDVAPPPHHPRNSKPAKYWVCSSWKQYYSTVHLGIFVFAPGTTTFDMISIDNFIKDVQKFTFYLQQEKLRVIYDSGL